MTTTLFHPDDVVMHDDGRIGVVVKIFEARHHNETVLVDFDGRCEIVRNTQLHDSGTLNHDVLMLPIGSIPLLIFDGDAWVQATPELVHGLL